METSIKAAIQSQYLAALAMLRAAVVDCPETMWDDEQDKNRFWQLAYHALFYTHLYLQPAQADFQPWAQQRGQAHELGPLPWDPQHKPEIGAPYSKAEILAYHDLCCAQVKSQVAALELDAPSGFDWIPLNKLELQFYTIRHIQQHVGELCERLGSRAQVDVAWVGVQHGAST